MCLQILEHDNFVNHIVIIREENFHISGRANRHNCVLQGTESPIELLERGSPEVNVCCALTHERFISRFSLMRISLQQFIPRHVGKLLSSAAQQQKSFCNWTVHPFILRVLSVIV
jgi:hypothetical protein